MASSGLVMQITKAPGACALIPSPTAFITFRLMPSRSSRLIPGLRGTPGGDDDDVGAGNVGIIAGAGQLGVETLDRCRIATGPAPCPGARHRPRRTIRYRPVPFAPRDAPACRRCCRRRSARSSCEPYAKRPSPRSQDGRDPRQCRGSFPRRPPAARRLGASLSGFGRAYPARRRIASGETKRIRL